MDWYNSLESVESGLNWAGITDLCQDAPSQVTCDNSNPKRVFQLYSFLFLFFFFSFLFFFLFFFFFVFLFVKRFLKYRDLSNKELNGTISIEFGNLTKLAGL